MSKQADDQRRARLGQYLDFVQLYSEVHQDVSNAKKEANVVWKEKIQKENGEALSSIDYLEQLAVLKSKKLLQKNPSSVPKHQMSECFELELACAGAQSSVEIAGTFNNWKPEPLKYSSKDEDWFTTIHLAPGKLCLPCYLNRFLTDDVWGVYYYKYVVDGEWLHDPKQECEDDGTGNINNVMRVRDKVTMKLKEINQKLEELRSFLDEPWQAQNNINNNFCVKK